MHFADASPYLRLYYFNLISRWGGGRARIALILKICGMMRRVLLEQEKSRWPQPSNSEGKLKRYEFQLKKIRKVKEERKSAWLST
jgi:transposase